MSENAVQTQALCEPSYSLSYVYFNTKDLIIGSQVTDDYFVLLLK